MEKEYIQVSFENGNIERKSYPAGIRLLDLAKEYQKEDDIVLGKGQRAAAGTVPAINEGLPHFFYHNKAAGRDGSLQAEYDAAFAEGTLPSGRA